MKTVVATDLDRTLIYSEAAIVAENGSGPLPELRCVEFLDGRKQSFMTEEAATQLERLSRDAILVPVTTRTLAQYERVQLPGGLPAFAVTSNGGHIVVDGVVDRGWRAGVDARIADDGAPLSDILAGLERKATATWVLNRRVADDLFCYLVVDLATLPTSFLATWTSWCAERGWVVSMQGRKIYALPGALTKESAIGEVIRRAGADRLLAAGDGALDAGFLLMADAAIRPAHGELAETGWQAAHLRIATAPGVLAGAQITGWLVDHVDTDALRKPPPLR